MTSALRALVQRAVEEFAASGLSSDAALQDWLMRLHATIEREMPSDAESKEAIATALRAVYDRGARKGFAHIPGVSRYTLERIAPELRAELDRRIHASVDLIRLNKKAATEKTLQRFAGWVSSVPRGGTAETDLRSVASEILKPVARVKYEARRVAVDQGHKLNAAISHVVAQGAGAIAAIWHDRGEHDKGYDARKEHLARSGKLYLVRDSWAMDEGLVKRGGPYTDEVDQPAERVYCSCWWEWITSPRSLPEEMLTEKGRQWVRGAA